MIPSRLAARSWARRLALIPALAVALALAAAPRFAAAATLTWTGTVNHLWSNSSNWTTGTSIGVPTTGDDVVLTNAGQAPSGYDLGSTHGGVNPQFHTVTLGANSAGYAIAPVAGSDVLTLQSGGSISDTNNDPAAPADAITTGVAVNGPTTISLLAGSVATTLTFSAKAITGTGAMTFVNNSTADALALNQANSYVGATAISGTAEMTAIAGAIPAASDVTLNTGSSLKLPTAALGSLSGAGNLVVPGATVTIGGTNNSTAFSGAISGAAGNLVKVGNGTLALSGTNTYTGTTAVNAGTLQVNGAIAAGAVTIGGAGTLGGTGTVGGTVTVAAGGGITPGAAGAGTLTVSGDITLNGAVGATPNARLTLSASDSTSTKLAVTGILHKGTAGNFIVDFLNSAAVAGNTYTLATFASTATSAFVAGDFSYTNLGANVAGSFAVSSTALTFTAVSAVPLVISSASTASGAVGTAFSYTITSSGTPISYGVSGTLPAGVSFSSSTGIISGTPTVGGVFPVTISANGGIAGTTTAPLTITITAGTLTVTGITVNDKTYDGTRTALLNTGAATLVGVAPGGNVTLNTAGAVGTFGDANAATAKTVTITGLTISGSDAAGYTLVQPTATGNIIAAAATVTLGGLSATYNGASHAATSTTVPASLAVGYTYNGSATAPTAAGSYAVIGTVTNTNYAGTGSGTLVIAQAPATVTLGHLSAFVTGSPIAATATTTPSGLTVALTYNGSATAPSAAGTYAVIGTITDPNYTGTASGTLTLTALTAATVTLGSLSAAYDTQTHAATATTTPSGLAVALTYNGSATAPSAVGSYAVVATITDPAYTGTASGTLVISQGAQTISFTQPAVISTTAPITLQATASSGLPVTFALVSGPASLNGAVLTLADKPGVVSIQATQAGNANYLAATPVTVSIGSYLPAPLVDVSILSQIDATQPSIVAGFVIAGSGTKSVLLRGVGPTLASFGVTSFLATPTLKLYDGAGNLVASNSGWAGSSALSALFAQLGAFPLLGNSVDAAASATLAPGSYSLVVTGAAGTAGLALAEVYDASGNPLAQTQSLVNVSSLGQVRTGLPVTAGFVITGSASRQILVRGLGPVLASFGVTGTVSDPVLSLYDSHNVLIAQNDNWGTTVTISSSYPGATGAAISAATAASATFSLTAGSKDAAILVTLPPGNYTAQVAGVAGGTGAGMIEIDEVP